MKKSRYSEEQIIAAIREADATGNATQVARKLGVTATTFYRWKSKYGGMDVSDAKRLRQLEDENSKLKKLVAEQLLDNQLLKAALGKKW